MKLKIASYKHNQPSVVDIMIKQTKITEAHKGKKEKNYGPKMMSHCSDVLPPLLLVLHES